MDKPSWSDLIGMAEEEPTQLSEQDAETFQDHVFDKVNKEQAEYAAKKLLDDIYKSARYKYGKNEEAYKEAVEVVLEEHKDTLERL